jgi:hypothetical protein
MSDRKLNNFQSDENNKDISEIRILNPATPINVTVANSPAALGDM